MLYTVGEMAKIMGVAPSTLRYYDKEGLLPFVERSEGGIRVFNEQNMEALSIIDCLKQSGLSIKDIRRFMDMVQRGDETIAQRLELFENQRVEVVKQMEKMQKTLDLLNYKCWYYETALQAGTTKVVEDMCIEDMPEKFAQLKIGMSKKTR